MISQTNILLAVAAQTGAVVGSIFSPTAHGGRTHIPISVALTAGTATIVLEGRNEPSEGWQSVNSVSTTTGYLAQRFNQLRVNVTAASAATLRVTTDEPMRQLNADGTNIAV